jgi:hypothetical protein
MVLLGLVLGVVVAVLVAAHGCGENHPRKRQLGQPQAVAATAVHAPAAGSASAAFRG